MTGVAADDAAQLVARYLSHDGPKDCSCDARDPGAWACDRAAHSLLISASMKTIDPATLMSVIGGLQPLPSVDSLDVDALNYGDAFVKEFGLTKRRRRTR